MQIYANQLDRPWHKVLPPQIANIYLIYGGELQQTIEAQTALLTQLKQHGFAERHSFKLNDPNFNWDMLANVANNFSLFSNKQIIELDINQANLGQTGSTALLKFIQSQPTDICLVLIADKLEANVRQSKWFATISKLGCVIVTKQIYSQQLPAYVASRFHAAEISLSKDAIAYIARNYAGNTVGIANLIAKMQLCLKSTSDLQNPLCPSNPSLYPSKPLDLENKPNSKNSAPLEIKNSAPLNIADITPFIDAAPNCSVFELIDTAISCDLKNTYKLLEIIKNSKIDPIIVIWAFIREVRTLLAIYYLTQTGISVADACSANGVWSTKVPAIRAYLASNPVVCLEKLLQNALKVDTMAKNIVTGLVWESISIIYLNLAGAKLHLKLEANI